MNLKSNHEFLLWKYRPILTRIQIDVDPMLVKCWAIVCAAGPTLNQFWWTFCILREKVCHESVVIFSASGGGGGGPGVHRSRRDEHWHERCPGPSSLTCRRRRGRVCTWPGWSAARGAGVIRGARLADRVTSHDVRWRPVTLTPRLDVRPPYCRRHANPNTRLQNNGVNTTSPESLANVYDVGQTFRRCSLFPEHTFLFSAFHWYFKGFLVTRTRWQMRTFIQLWV